MIWLIHLFLFLPVSPDPAVVPARSVVSETGNRFSSVFTREDYPGANQNWGIVQDSLGILYIANNDGILTWDGSVWSLVPISSDQTPVRAIARDETGRIWAGGEGHFGYLTHTSASGLSFTPVLLQLPDSAQNWSMIRKIIPHRNKLIVVTPEAVFTLSGGTVTVFTPDQPVSNAWLVNDKILIRIRDTGLVQLDGTTGILLSGDSRFGSEDVYALLPSPENQVLSVSRQSGLILWDSSFSKASVSSDFTAASAYLTNNRVYHAEPLSDGSIAFPTLLGGVLITTAGGKIIDRLTSENGLRENKSYAVHEDRQGVLWICHERGLTRLLYRSPVTFWNDARQLTGSVYDLIRHRGDLYVATGSGLFLLRGHETLPVSGISTQVWKLASDGTHLYAATNDGLFAISGVSSQALTHDATYSLLILKQGILAGIRSGLILVSKNGTRKSVLPSLTDQFRSLLQHRDGSIWASSRLNGLFQFSETDLLSDGTTIRHLTTGSGLPGNSFNQVHRFGSALYAATQQGFFRWNEAGKRFESADRDFAGRPAGLATYLAISDEEGWIVTDDRRLFRPADAGWQLADSALFSKVPAMEFWAMLAEPGGIIWVGGTEGLYRIDRHPVKRQTPDLKPLIRTATFTNGPILHLPADGFRGDPVSFSANSVRFSFALPDFHTTRRLPFRFRLDGFDQDWSGATFSSDKEYTNLPQGHYVFRVKGLRSDGNWSEETTFHFRVLAPWYQTWWMISIWVLMAAGLIGFIVRIRLNQLQRDKEALEERVSERTAELEKTLIDLKSVQTQLIQSEKMASLGILTGGVAHEINNPVNFIHGALPALRQDLLDLTGLISTIRTRLESEPGQSPELILSLIREIQPDELRDEINSLLEGIESGTNRTISIVKALKNFSRLDEQEIKPVNLAESIQSVLLFLKPALSDRIAVNSLISQDLVVEGYPAQINQVLMNILTNSAEAIGSKGTITIRGSEQGGQIQLSITDDGEGMAEKTVVHAFDPFFTTRPTGTHKGLGLSIAYQIIQNHSGTISLESQPGKGTTVSIALPSKWSEDPR